MVRLIIFECHKHFFKKSILLVLILFCIINTVKIGYIYKDNSLLSSRISSNWKDLYWQQYEILGKEITLPKINSLMDIYRPLEKQTADLTASTVTDNPNTFTGNVYSDYFFFNDLFVRPMEYFYSYEFSAKNIVSEAIDNTNFYKEYNNVFEIKKNIAIANLFQGRSIKSFEYIEMYKYLLQYDFSTLLCLCLCLLGLINVLIIEKETEMDMLLLTTKAGGRKTILAKIIASALFIVAICSLFWLVDFIAFASFFGSLEGSSAPLFALQNFEYTSVKMNLLQYTFFTATIKTCGMLTIGMGILAISCLFKNALLPFILSLVGVLILALSANQFMGSGHLLLKTVNPFILLQNYELYRKTEFINFFTQPILSHVSALFFALLWTIFMLFTILFISKKNAHYKRLESFYANFITRS